MIAKLSIFVSSLAATLIFSGCGGDDASSSGPLSLSVIHLNDTHSHLASESMTLAFEGVSTKVQIGGYPRVVSKVKELQTQKQNTLTLNAGDTFQGTLYYSLFEGKADSDMLNMISWDALELGNHEFDDGDTALSSFLGDLTIPNVLAANIEVPNDNVLFGKFKPYFIKEFNGQKVGVVGIVTKQKTEVSSNPSDAVIFYDEVVTAQKYIDELKEQGVDKIVLLTHVGLDNDKAYAQQLSGVDIIIGGDSHSLMGDFSAVGLQSNESTYPYETTNKDGQKVCIGHSWQYAYAVGAMDVSFDEKGVISECSGDTTLLLGDSFTQANESGEYVAVLEDVKSQILNIINSKANLQIVAEDTQTLSKLQSYADQVEEQKSVVIGEASERLGHTRIPDTTDGVKILPLGSDIAPIVAKSFYDLSNRADACIQNAGGVRISVEEGNITMDTAYTMLPFANTLYEIDMYGSEIKQVLEDALTNYLDNGGSTGSFPYAYGLRYDVNTNASTNNRISNLEIKERTSGTWEAIDNAKMYVVVTNNYIADGKDGYLTFKTVQDERGEGVDTYLDYAMSFVKYVENKTAQGEKVSKLPAEEHCIKSYNAVLQKISSYNTSEEAGSEISSYDETTKRLFTTNGATKKLDIISIADVTNPTLYKSIDITPYGADLQSVAVHGGLVAVAVGSADKVAQKGKIVLFDTNGDFQRFIEVGYLPDMVTFTQDGTKILVANEGEPDASSGTYVDVAGSIGIINTSNWSYADLGFSTIALTNAQDATPVRLGATPSNSKTLDMEPEYITINGNYAYVTLQENNALAKVNLTNNSIELVKSLGAKSYADDTNNTIDIEEEGEIKMQHYNGLYGLYMPDTIESTSINNITYLITANEGDGREYLDSADNDVFVDEKKISKLTLDSSISAQFEDDNDLKVVIDMGDSDSDGDYDKLYAYGARSFSIWDENANLIYDSGDDISKKVAAYEPELFNQDDGEMDGRSGNKGAEPEALTVGIVGDKTYAFVGLERQNAIMVYDISNVNDVKFVQYLNTQKQGDMSPEGMKFIASDKSPNGKNLLVVSFEVSGSTAIYEILE